MAHKTHTTVKRRRRWSPRDLPLPAAAALTIGALLLAAFLVLWLTGRPEGGDWWLLHEKPLDWKDRLTIAGAVAAGAGAAVALVVSYRKQRDAEDSKFANDFAAAAAQLGDAAPAVRIAGVYALSALADRHHDRRQQCTDALCGYLRLNYDAEAHSRNLSTTTQSRTLAENGGQETETVTYRPDDREVRLTIIRTIREHLRDPHSATNWCSYNFDFTDVTFDGCDFTRATFNGRVSFDGATFSGGPVSFREATFSGEGVSFNNATFNGEWVSFNNATFNGQWVRFDEATFNGQWVRFGKATFNGQWVRFDEATFNGERVSFDEATFNRKWVTFNNATFNGERVSFNNATFNGERVSFDEATFNGKWVTFNNATFNGERVSFDEATFNGGQVTRNGHPFRGWPEPDSTHGTPAARVE